MKKSGFTLIEILLSIVMIGILSMISVPIYQSFQDKNNLNIATQTIVQALRQTQTYAYSGKEDSDWGVHIGAINPEAQESCIIFKGSDYDNRDQNFDELIDLPKNITHSANQDIIFTKFTGKAPLSDIQIPISSNGKTKTIRIYYGNGISY